jgi:hypothetical protein
MASEEEVIEIVDYKTFDFETLEFLKPEKSKSGSFVANAKYNGNNLYIQTPRLNCATLIQSENRCAMDLVFDKTHGKFYDFITTIDDYSIIQIQKNSKSWFNREFPLDIVEEYYKTPVKIGRKNKPPSLKLKVPVSKGQPNIIIYDSKNNEMDFNKIKENTKVLSVLKFVGLKFLKQQVICEWVPVQIKSYQAFAPRKNTYLIKDNLLTDDEGLHSESRSRKKSKSKGSAQKKASQKILVEKVNESPINKLQIELQNEDNENNVEHSIEENTNLNEVSTLVELVDERQIEESSETHKNENIETDVNKEENINLETNNSLLQDPDSVSNNFEDLSIKQLEENILVDTTSQLIENVTDVIEQLKETNQELDNIEDTLINEPVLEEEEPNTEPVVAEEEPNIEPVLAEEEPNTEPVAAEEEPNIEPVLEEEEPNTEPVLEEEEPNTEPVAAEEEPNIEPVLEKEEPNTEPVVADAEPNTEPAVADAEPNNEPVLEKEEQNTEPVLEREEPNNEPVLEKEEPNNEPVLEKEEPVVKENIKLQAEILNNSNEIVENYKNQELNALNSNIENTLDINQINIEDNKDQDEENNEAIYDFDLGLSDDDLAEVDILTIADPDKNVSIEKTVDLSVNELKNKLDEKDKQIEYLKNNLQTIMNGINI